MDKARRTFARRTACEGPPVRSFCEPLSADMSTALNYRAELAGRETLPAQAV